MVGLHGAEMVEALKFMSSFVKHGREIPNNMEVSMGKSKNGDFPASHV